MIRNLSLFLCVIFLFSCSDTTFNAGLENRLIAIIDMAPESYQAKVNFTSDDDVGGCADHEFVKLDQWTDGSADNTYFTIQIEANDYFKSQNNCNEYDWYVTEEEDVMHKLIITAYVNDISEQMYIAGSHYSNHPDLPTNVISAYYKLERDQDGNDNGGLGIEYYGYDAELNIAELDINNGIMSGTFNATLYRATAAPSSFMGVDNPPNLDLFNPTINDYILDSDGDGTIDWHLADSIRIEDCVFQRINVINNI
jgi:hypothetical protein|tara:strand:+ start:9004 stop:9765 length:762 start_codon:yes stop_codon:yes gene_type:complete